nr:reverse transcriptase domain-containing protein [Tanacetum cinerariifolium]
MIFNIGSAIKHCYSNDDICFSIDEILEEDFDALLDEGRKILHSIEGTFLEEEIFSEFDKFIAMAADENYDAESDEEKPKFKKITINTDYKIKRSLEEPSTDLELKPLPGNLEYVFLEELFFLLEKCHFLVKEGIVLGHKVCGAGLEVNKAKIDVILKLPPPTNIKECSKIARPMTHLLEKETPFVFSKDCIDAFETLEKKLTEAPVLVVPNWNLPFELMCDASDFAIGTVLIQRKMKHFQPIHYASKTMIESQIHYTMMKKEMLAVVKRRNSLRTLSITSRTIPTFFGYVQIKSFDGVCMDKKLIISSKLVMKDPAGAIMVPISSPRKRLFKFVKILMYGEQISWDHSRPHEGI